MEHNMVSTKPVKGTRDFLPADVRCRRFVIKQIETVYHLHGFEPLETPTMERLDTLLDKYGDEGDQLIFRIMKRGQSLTRALGNEPSESTLGDLGLRYDLTVPLARVFAEYQNDLPRYFKRYQIQPVWRADRPQKGRFREFYQCDVDIVGCTTMMAEADVLSAASMCLDRLGFDDVRIRLNHRDLLFGLIAVSGIPEDASRGAIVTLDKLDKVGWDGVKTELASKGLAEEVVEKLQALFTLPEGLSADDALNLLEERLGGNPQGQKGVTELRELLAFAAPTPAHRRITVDPYLARGLSYYTGPIFELASDDFRGSLGAGGRYDGLVGMFLGRDVPAVGLSLGLERLLVLMEERGLFPDTLGGAGVMVACMGNSTRVDQVRIASELRQSGLSVDLYPEKTKVAKQLRYAESRGIRFVVMAGSREVEAGIFGLKDLESGEQHKVALGEIGDLVARLNGAAQ